MLHTKKDTEQKATEVGERRTAKTAKAAMAGILQARAAGVGLQLQQQENLARCTGFQAREHLL